MTTYPQSFTVGMFAKKALHDRFRQCRISEFFIFCFRCFTCFWFLMNGFFSALLSWANILPLLSQSRPDPDDRFLFFPLVYHLVVNFCSKALVSTGAFLPDKSPRPFFFSVFQCSFWTWKYYLPFAIKKKEKIFL